MGSSSRAPAPPPLNINNPSRAMTSPVFTAPQSADSGPRSYSSDDYYQDMMMMASSPPPSYSRKASGISTGSAGTMGTTTSTKKVKSPKVNAHSYCGRHSDQYLFGGHSIGDLWRNITK